MATYDTITATDDVTAATDDVMYLICIFLQHHNSSCYGIMTSHFKMLAKTRDFCPNSNLFLKLHMKILMQ